MTRLEVGQVLDELPESRGGPRSPREIAEVYLTAKRNPGRWVVAALDERQGARTWILRRHPDLFLATRQLSHNSPGRVTVFVMILADD